jgi:trehalose 2-sulfotransferase
MYDLATTAHDYPPWDGSPRRTILICTHPRSGSTLLGEAIHAVGGLGSPLEYFHRGFRPPIERHWGVSGIEAFGREVHRLRTDPSGTLSVKLFWRDVEDIARELDPVRFATLEAGLPPDAPAETYREIAATLAPLFPNPTFVSLIRRDRLRQAVSTLAAEQSRLWRSIPGFGAQEAAQELVYGYERILRLVAGADRCNGHWGKFFATLGQAPAAITYEDLIADYAGTVERLLRHLGCDAEAPPLRLRRQSDERSERMMLRFLRERAEREAS